MPGAVRRTLDTAGGKLIQGSENVIINNELAVRIGDRVEAHVPFVPLHTPAPKMAEGSPNVIVNNIPLCRAGDKANCGHAATGSPNVIVN
jgi:uncharacterized Zn-binding protein involved in type VI secretion